VLVVIGIPVIRDLAIAASLGVVVLVFTNLVLLPVLLSMTGVSPRAARRAMKKMKRPSKLLRLARFTRRSYAACALLAAAGLGVGAYVISLNLQVGDLDNGVPELRASSRYNRDNVFFAKHYGLSSDQFVVIVKGPGGKVGTYQTLIDEDRLAQELRGLPFVQTVDSASQLARFATAGNNEGSPKWLSVNRDQAVVSLAMNTIADDRPELLSSDWSVGTVIAYLADHKAKTLSDTVKTVERFATSHNSEQVKFLLAAGTAGIDAATNITVEKANREMLYLVYAAVIVLCFATFRSWRAVLVAIIPLALTSIMCEALMVIWGIGVKVATLPVIALGVGIGVDYALYLLSVQLAQQRAGVPLEEAYSAALSFTGRVVALVGVTLAAGVVTWVWSPIKFQVDMGILLTFMFLWNMLGALVIIPALSCFLLRDVSGSRAKVGRRGDGRVERITSGMQSTQATVDDAP